MKLFAQTIKYAMSILLVVGVVLVFRTSTSEASSPYFRANQDNVPVYENKTGSLVQVGSLTKGQSFKITKDYGANWWQIQFGNLNGYVYKGAVEPVNTADYSNANTKYKNSTTTITALQDVSVYDNSSGSLVQFAAINKNVTFPILFKNGNWYAIDLDGRIGYVYNTGVKANVPQTSTPPVTNVNYIKALENAPIYDNRTGSLIQVGTLTKGQTLKITKDYGANWWQIQFGSFSGYILKSAVEPVSAPDYKNANTKYKNSATTVTALQNVPVYDNSSGSLVQFATLYKNVTFPILFKSGNWYAIDLDGRIGYVYYTGVKANVPQTSTPSAPVSGKIYIQAIIDAPIYDNRRGNLDEFATLKKGQALQVTKDYGTNWWQVKWGNTYGYIRKSSVNTIKTQTFKNVNSSYKTTTKHIVPTQNNVPVYDNTSGKLVQFASLKANHRYPIISTDGNWYLLDIGGRYGYVYKTGATVSKGIPVLMYHHILDESELGSYKGVSTTITTEQFQREMDYLSKAGFETITTDTLLKYIQGKINLPGNVVAITFDDGLLSTRENAYPIMKKYGIKATQYLITARNYGPTQVFRPTGSLQFFSQEDKVKMSDVWDYQSHTFNFHNLINGKSFVVLKSYAELKEDLQKNKKDLPNSTSFAYPFGQYNATTIRVLKELKYTNAMTTKEGYANIGDDPYQIKRFGIYQRTSFDEFKNIVHGRK